MPHKKKESYTAFFMKKYSFYSCHIYGKALAWKKDFKKYIINT